MRLFEILTPDLMIKPRAKPTFYLSTPSPQTSGAVVSAAPSEPLGIEREDILERHRPEKAPQRRLCHYLQTEPPSGENVYRIAAVGAYARCHTSWLEDLERACMQDADTLTNLAIGYWSGQAASHDAALPWQHISSHAEILGSA